MTPTIEGELKGEGGKDLELKPKNDENLTVRQFSRGGRVEGREHIRWWKGLSKVKGSII
jgi:hypothetical protein